ncbi:AAA family ATPase [Paenibacillus chartarius]|uniref:AAA family ATPase n=1 Tax=Paenibacillus chartarius TaxID=747481 RepID=A0ABV6DGQ0_9BACL
MPTNKWDLYIKEFGKIKEANISVTPFMIFVGKNNSGKSYLMLLLWGILSESRSLIQKYIDEYRGFNELLTKFTNQFNESDSNTIILNEEDQDKLLEAYNQMLRDQQDSLLKKVFRFPINIRELVIKRDNQIPFKLGVKHSIRSVKRKEINEDSKDASIQIYHGTKELLEAVYINPDPEGVVRFFLRYSLTLMITEGFYNDPFSYNQDKQPLYLPASRTGFMHTYRAIVGNLFESSMSENILVNEREDSANQKINGTELTYPVIQFLSKLQRHSFDDQNMKVFQEEIDFLNQELLSGEVQKDESNMFRFRPLDSEIAYPMHITSSLVAEIAPITIFLSSNTNPDLWIIEEIESHLHSEMQLKMARFLFRLLNKQKSVWITTHSDNLAQQINNLLTLSQHPKRDDILSKLQYSSKDVLDDVTIVNAYQFSLEDGFTTIKSLPLNEYGFVMETFNDTLVDLVKITDYIQNYSE